MRYEMQTQAFSQQGNRPRLPRVYPPHSIVAKSFNPKPLKLVYVRAVEANFDSSN